MGEKGSIEIYNVRNDDVIYRRETEKMKADHHIEISFYFDVLHSVRMGSDFATTQLSSFPDFVEDSDSSFGSDAYKNR